MVLQKEIERETQRVEERKEVTEKTIADLDGKIKFYTMIAWLFVGLGFIVALVGFYTYIGIDIKKEYGLNLLGDFMAGTVSATWSLAGLFFIYVAFLGQKQQLLNQKLEIMYSQLELKFTRLELKGQKEEMARQNDTLSQQRFENTLFQLISNHHEIVAKLSHGTGKKKKEQGEVLLRARLNLYNYIGRSTKDWLSGGSARPDNRPKNVEDALTEIREEYTDFCNSSIGGSLSHYFQNLYHIFKYIYTTDAIPNDRKQFYATLVRAQLSFDELTLMFYNSLVPEFGYPNFLFLIREFDILKRFELGVVEDWPFHKEAYKHLLGIAEPDWKNWKPRPRISSEED
jgi:hypothetical protein